ncbi:hypothetical protein B0T21DRAFT_441978 [Apiosordaria backusii]|uniref:Uncharacterized protein n=1 Tax=Apiosordaria backusii TaxID=314023 RepID=A0AA40BJQ5_9PEZI|nr:hypothetical protein B0T21DRAFT_441978 [Apiosordaria backusii]
MMTWTCCQCDFDNRDGGYCGGQLPGGGQIAYPVACGHSRCLMCGEGMERPAQLYSQAGYQGYHQRFSQSEAYQPLFASPPTEHLSHTQGHYFHTEPPAFQHHRFDQPPHLPNHNPQNYPHDLNPAPPNQTPQHGPQHGPQHVPQPSPPPTNPNSQQQQHQHQESILQNYLTSRITSQSRKPLVMTIGDFDKMMSGPRVYTPPVGYLADYAILTSGSNSSHPSDDTSQKLKKRDKKREEMMLREEKASFGFAERVWRRHCEVMKAQNANLDEYGGGIEEAMQQGGEGVKMELDEGEYYQQLQQMSRKRRGKQKEIGEGDDIGGRSKKARNKGREKQWEREREEVGEVARVLRRDKGKERERGQDFFTATVQGGQRWSFGGLDLEEGMDVDEGEGG